MQFIKFKYYLKYLFAIVNIKVHHLAQRVEDLDAKFFLFISSNRSVCLINLRMNPPLSHFLRASVPGWKRYSGR